MKSPIAILILLGLAFVASSKVGVDSYLSKEKHQAEKNVADKPKPTAAADKK